MLSLIDLGRPVVFVHLPKTGGTSIRHERQISEARWFDPDPAWASYPSFAVVREPFARLESCWRDFRFQRGHTREDFAPFMARMMQATEEEIADPRSMQHHAAPMVHPVHGLRHAGVILSFDDLEDDFRQFCREIGVRPFELRRLRASNDAPRAEFPPGLRGRLRDHYARDFDLWRCHI